KSRKSPVNQWGKGGGVPGFSHLWDGSDSPSPFIMMTAIDSVLLEMEVAESGYPAFRASVFLS
ncbi:MAG: hypothetical protein RBS13_07060, partial [Bacteroidales bacterium]|nr:hypothetical protein [Bacteroidales bacterium]